MSRIIIAAIIVIALAVPVGADSDALDVEFGNSMWMWHGDGTGEYVTVDFEAYEVTPVIDFPPSDPDWRWIPTLRNKMPNDINPPALEARIAKLEAELRRVAALVYTIHGYGRIDACNMRVPNDFGKHIAECLANVTIEEENMGESSRAVDLSENSKNNPSVSDRPESKWTEEPK